MRAPNLAAALILIAAAAFLFLDPATMPIRVWDESRNIVNALEMARGGPGLVTTYAGAPDLWNTKPPLLIWLMSASIHAFGPSEIALRLPSMLAGLGTIVLLFWFTRRTTRSTITAALACALLVLSPAFYGEHSPRTADYDALLVFFTTGYLCLLFLALHRPRLSWALLAIIGGAIVCAFLTKSIAALVPGAGVALYLLLANRWRRVLTGRYLITGAATLGAIIGYLLLREAQSPYLAAALFNDAQVRFAEPAGMAKPAAFYLDQLRAGYFAAPLLLALAPVALLLTKARERLVLLYALCISIGLLAIFTSAAWKLNHYILPAFPFFAIAAAITARALFAKAMAALRSDSQTTRLIGVAMAALAITPLLTGAAYGIARRYQPPEIGEHGEASRYRALFEAIVPQADRGIVAVDPGFMLEGKPHYAPVLLAYREIWAARGVAIAHATALPAPGRAILASCDPATAVRLRTLGPDIGGVAHCTAIRTE